MVESENGILLPGDTDVDGLGLVGDSDVAENPWAAYSVTEEPSGRIFTSLITGKVVGQLHNIGSSSMKATCKIHSGFSAVPPHPAMNNSYSMSPNSKTFVTASDNVRCCCGFI